MYFSSLASHPHSGAGTVSQSSSNLQDAFNDPEFSDVVVVSFIFSLQCIHSGKVQLVAFAVREVLSSNVLYDNSTTSNQTLD